MIRIFAFLLDDNGSPITALQPGKRLVNIDHIIQIGPCSYECIHEGQPVAIDGCIIETTADGYIYSGMTPDEIALHVMEQRRNRKLFTKEDADTSACRYSAGID